MAINNVIDHTTVQLELLLSVISEASLAINLPFH